MTTETITVTTETETITADTETIRRVHFDLRCIEVAVDPTNENWVQFRSVEDDANEYFEQLDVTLPPAVALALGKALVALATEIGVDPA